MYLRLQHRTTRRWHVLSVQPTLFGEWVLVRERGGAGMAGEQTIAHFATLPEALVACHACRARETERGYVARPEQLDLPL